MEPKEYTFLLRESPKGNYVKGDVRYSVYMHNEKHRLPDDIPSLKARTIGEAAILFGAEPYPVSAGHVAPPEKQTDTKEKKYMHEHDGYSYRPMIVGGGYGHGDGLCGGGGLGLVALLALLGGRGGCGGLFGGNGGCGDNGAETRILAAVQNGNRDDQIRGEVHDVRARLDGVADKFDCKLSGVKDDICHLGHRLEKQICDVEKNVLKEINAVETRRLTADLAEEKAKNLELKHALRDKDIFCRFENLEKASSGNTTNILAINSVLQDLLNKVVTKLG